MTSWYARNFFRRAPSVAAVLVMALTAAACGAGPTPAVDTPAIDTPATDTPATDTQARPSTAAPPSATVTPPTGDGATATATAVPVTLRVGAEILLADRLDELRSRRVGLVANPASTVDGEALFDVLARHPDVDLVAGFGPEHGIRGTEPAGAAVTSGIDEATGVPVRSLYGDGATAPRAAVLDGIDVLLFDLQDVGARPYTYASTMGLTLVAANEAGVDVIVLDRPNPLGGTYVDGPARQPDQVSLVSRYPVPLAHGMTMGELALAMRGEGWLPGLDGVRLDVIPVVGWRRSARWSDLGRAWVAPSPSLPSTSSVELYPATVWFEATSLSVGRGTSEPFTAVGAPWIDAPAATAELARRNLPGLAFGAATMTPTASAAVPSPPYVGRDIPAVRLTVTDPATARPAAAAVHLLDVVTGQARERGLPGPITEPALFDLLAGTSEVRTALERGDRADDIVTRWDAELAAFARLRQPYLLYD
ncbi:MAG: exo-beta-N-acetylmuramidase NamZ domain-containing protein [Acidimicrobiales bacterium]